ncbi:hypothetical protein D3C81_1856260 [compost metagenome]
MCPATWVGFQLDMRGFYQRSTPAQLQCIALRICWKDDSVLIDQSVLVFPPRCANFCSVENRIRHIRNRGSCSGVRLHDVGVGTVFTVKPIIPCPADQIVGALGAQQGVVTCTCG